MKNEEKDIRKPTIWTFEKRYLPIKFTYFFAHAALAALVPFFVTYYFELGLTATELSIIQAATTFFAFFVRPVVGRIADKSKYYRVCTVICLLWCGVAHLPHMFMPRMPEFGSREISNNSANVSVPDVENDNSSYIISNETAHKEQFLIAHWIPDSRFNVFLVFLILRLVASLGSSPAMSLVDTFGYALSQGNQKLWGRQRTFSTFGWAFSSLSIGYIIHHTSTHYYLFPVAGVLYICAAISVCCLQPLKRRNHLEGNCQNSSEKLNADKNTLWKVLRKPEVIIYLAFTVINGVCLAFEYNFLFLFLKENGADELLIGMHQVVDSIVELPMFFFSGHIIKYLGYVPCFCLSFVAYFVRLLGYSFLGDPLYLVLLIEITHGVSFTLFLAAGSGYADILTPPNCPATLQALFHSFYFSLGIGIGELIGGYIYPAVGARWFFRYGALLALFCAMLYTVVWYIWLRNLEKVDMKKKPETESADSEEIEGFVPGVQIDATAFDTNQVDCSPDAPMIDGKTESEELKL